MLKKTEPQIPQISQINLNHALGLGFMTMALS